MTSYDLAPALIGAALLLIFGLYAACGERISQWINQHRINVNHARGNQ